MDFEGHHIPDAVDWVATIRQVTTPPYNLALGDDRPLDWIMRLVGAHPEHAQGIADAFLVLLAEDDASRRAQILEQLTRYPIDLAPQLDELLSTHHSSFALQPDPHRVDGQTILGTFVRTFDALCAGRRRAPIQSVGTLESIRRPEDGWPEALLLALRAEPDKLAADIPLALSNLSGESYRVFSERLLGEETQALDPTLVAIGRATPGIRDLFAKTARDLLKPSASVMDQLTRLAAMSRLPMPTDPSNRWPHVAQLLGVSEK